MANAKDYYVVLGVSASATAEEIKKQYRRLAKQHHPDANASDAKSAERFKEISEAYGVLGDVEKRKQYDDMRRLGAFGGGSGYSSARSGARPQPGGPQSQQTYQDFDVGGIGGLGEIFSQMFGGGGARPRARAPERGDTIEKTVDVPFRAAATGGKVEVELEVNEECGTCHGNGGAPGSSLRPCGECKGRGVISFGQGSFAVNRPCPVCMGRGQIPSERCPTCNGVGEVRSVKRVSISVPAGAESGTKVRLKGQGPKGTAGGVPGDLLITFNVLKDKFYKRDGLDLVASVPINIAQATLGSRVSIKTLDGKKVAVRIPSGTSSGKRFRISGQGVEKDGKRGDLYVEIAIAVPDELSEAQEKAMREFAEAGGLKF
ncbi:MAG: J domain-containing protein [Gemmatimonadaceae bacterium]